MGVITINNKFITKVSPERMFKALILDSNDICQKLMFSSIKSIEFIQGDGDVGSIKQTNFTQASPYNYVKHRIDALDKEGLMCKYTLIEGDALGRKLEYVSYTVNFEGYGRGGCICNLTSEYKAKEGVEIKQQDIEDGKDRAIGMYEALEAYLMANPRAFT